MSLQSEVEAQSATVQRITAVARRSSCPEFADILWPPTPEAMSLMDDPGVMFESPSRVLVFQWIVGELRYYAGGWPLTAYGKMSRLWAPSTLENGFTVAINGRTSVAGHRRSQGISSLMRRRLRDSSN